MKEPAAVWARQTSAPRKTDVFCTILQALRVKLGRKSDGNGEAHPIP
jgi:hypothetical protein